MLKESAEERIFRLRLVVLIASFCGINTGLDFEIKKNQVLHCFGSSLAKDSFESNLLAKAGSNRMASTLGPSPGDKK